MNIIFNGMRAVTDRSLRFHDCRRFLTDNAILI